MYPEKWPIVLARKNVEVFVAGKEGVQQNVAFVREATQQSQVVWIVVGDGDEPGGGDGAAIEWAAGSAAERDRAAR